jgi:hypothetical protein
MRLCIQSHRQWQRKSSGTVFSTPSRASRLGIQPRSRPNEAPPSPTPYMGVGTPGMLLARRLCHLRYEAGWQNVTTGTRRAAALRRTGHRVSSVAVQNGGRSQRAPSSTTENTPKANSCSRPSCSNGTKKGRKNQREHYHGEEQRPNFPSSGGRALRRSQSYARESGSSIKMTDAEVHTTMARGAVESL